MDFVCVNLVGLGCILPLGLLWGLACAKHGLNGNGGSLSLSGNDVRPLWVKFRVVFGCPEASDWAKVVIIDYFGMVHRTLNDSQTSIYV